MDERSKAILMAKFAEQTDRYDDMVTYMKEAVEASERELTMEERNLLSVAFKNVIGAKRSSWRILNSIRKKNPSETEKLQVITESLKKVEEELNKVCQDVLNLLNSKLINSATESESKIFYLKMKGDYHRYLAEVTDQNDKRDDKQVEAASQAYEDAFETAKKDLPSTHPIRLGLALNFSVYHYEIAGDSKRACELAKQAFDDAIAELDNLTEDSYKDSTLIMQLLRDNLTLWTADDKEQVQED